MTSPERYASWKAKLGDRTYRLNNLYYIKDKDGNVVRFVMNRAQRRLLKRLHTRNVILKARQMGFSTFIQIFLLDLCLFNSNISAGVVAQDRETAEEIFENKIKFAFDHLPDALRERLAPSQDSVRKLVFSNGSSIKVGTSLRGGTNQGLHVSEMGKIAAKYPAKAKEIVTGSFETVPLSGFIFVESTAEGREGQFYDMVDVARKLEDSGKELTSLDFKFHFFPWFEDPTNVLDPEGVVIVPRRTEYFNDLERKLKIKLDARQRAWYVKKAETLGDDMKREHPSTPDEAFEISVEGAYYASQFRWLRQNDRITKVPHNPALPIITAWDLGVSDYTSIWFAQILGREVRIIDFFQDNNEELAYYARILQEKERDLKYHYSRNLAPHDLNSRGRWSARKGIDVANEAGLKFEVIPAVSVNSTIEAIEPVRRLLQVCWFDEEMTAEGLKSLENYRKEWDENKGMFRDRPLHNWASHASKAFEVMARADLFGSYTPTARPVQQKKIAV